MSGTLCTVKLRLLRVFFPFSISKIIFFLLSLSRFFIRCFCCLCFVCLQECPIPSFPYSQNTHKCESPFNLIHFLLHFILNIKFQMKNFFCTHFSFFFLLLLHACVSLNESDDNNNNNQTMVMVMTMMMLGLCLILSDIIFLAWFFFIRTQNYGLALNVIFILGTHTENFLFFFHTFKIPRHKKNPKRKKNISHTTKMDMGLHRMRWKIRLNHRE